jgi:hypothetical protein
MKLVSLKMKREEKQTFSLLSNKNNPDKENTQCLSCTQEKSQSLNKNKHTKSIISIKFLECKKREARKNTLTND